MKTIKRLAYIIIGFILFDRGCYANFQSDVLHGKVSNWGLLFLFNLFVSLLGLLLFLYGLSNDGNDSASKSSHRDLLLSELYREEDALMKSCFNMNTCKFDWYRFHDKKDVLLYCGFPEIVSQMESDMCHFGRLQILHIQASVLLPYGTRTYDPDRLLAELGEEEPVFLDLTSMYYRWNGKTCPSEVSVFRDMLYDLLYHRKPCTRSNIVEASQLAERALKIAN